MQVSKQKMTWQILQRIKKIIKNIKCKKERKKDGIDYK